MSRGGRRPGGKFRKARKARLGLWTLVALVALVGGYVFVVVDARPHFAGDRLRIDTFVDLAGRGMIKDARVLDQDAYVVGTYARDDGTLGRFSTPVLKIVGTESILQILLQSRVPTTIDPQYARRLLDPVGLLIPAMIVVVMLVYLLLSFRRKSGLFGIRSGARRVSGGDSDATFADVAGQDAAVTELREIKDFLSDPGRFTSLGALVPKGILLYGPPGCGKTLLARAVASEAGAAFYSIAGSDFVEVYVGVGAARMRDLFKEARENAPAIVFIDELDSVGRRRRSGVARSGADEEQEQALNQILAELDGFSPLQGIIVIGATNRPDVLDPALLRPGRFDRTIGLERPSEEGRRAILAVHARNKRLDDTVDLDDLARRSIGLAGADLASVMNEGALLAARAGSAAIAGTHLEAALMRILEAPERQRRLSMRDRSFGRSTGGEERVTFAEVAGLDEAIAELAEVRDYLAAPERFVEMGARPPRGFLLVGPPGCGKTLLARAVAVEANAAFFSIASTQFVEALVGEGAARVRDLFAEAKSAAPSIVFIDEVDAIGSRRGATGTVGDAEQTLNQILIELDGFEPRAGVIVMAASNRPEVLDPALVRPGRFDRTLIITPPDRRARSAILALHAQGKRLAADVDLDVVARTTQGFSGADLANALNEAALLATRRRLPAIDAAVVNEAVERVGIGIAGHRSLSERDRLMISYHEAGHALVGLILPGARTPHRISLVARGHSLGNTWHTDDADRMVFGRSAMLDEMAGMLGGRAAEELALGEAGSGSAEDLRQVRHLSRRMVCDLGMGRRLATVAYGDADGSGLDVEVGAVIEEAYGRAEKVLAGARATLDRLATALLSEETIGSERLRQLVPEAVPESAP